MKKVLAAAAALAVSLSLAACSQEEVAVTTVPTIPMLTEAPDSYDTPVVPELTESPSEETAPMTEAPVEEPTEEETQEVTEAPTEAPEETKAPDTLPGLEGIQGVEGTIYNTYQVNVRKKPTAKSDLVKTLKSGETVTVYQVLERDHAMWCQTNYGWIAQQYVKLSGKLPEPDPRLGIQATVYNTASVNIRKEPSVQSEKVTTLKRDTMVTVYETTEVQGTTWGRIDEGWVSMKYVKLPKGKVPPKADSVQKNEEDGIEAVG